ncbi:hypothetical protein QYE76_039167 [Lolium multiflorum]|nr:hypothetical protein QYE76_039167 [Lolium multiflorum]
MQIRAQQVFVIRKCSLQGSVRVGPAFKSARTRLQVVELVQNTISGYNPVSVTFLPPQPSRETGSDTVLPREVKRTSESGGSHRRTRVTIPVGEVGAEPVGGRKPKRANEPPSSSLIGEKKTRNSSQHATRRDARDACSAQIPPSPSIARAHQVSGVLTREADLGNLAGAAVGLRARARAGGWADGAEEDGGEGDDCRLRPWRRRLLASMAFSWPSAIRLAVGAVLLCAVGVAVFTLPVEKILKGFLIWIKENLGAWGPLVLALAYIPLTVLAVPASILTLGGGYLFGLPVGFVADSIGATIGATAAFLLGRTIGRPYVLSKCKDYPKFQAVAIAIQRSGFKIVLLLRLVPLLPFNMLNYLLSVTPVGIVEYMLASWLGMMPITLALVYVGTTLKDLSDVTHGWSEISTTRWVFIVSGFVMSVLLIICVTKVAKSSLDKALAENGEVDIGTSQLPVVASPSDLHQPLVIKIDSSNEDHEK